MFDTTPNSTMPPEHVLATLRSRRPMRWQKPPKKPAKGHYGRLADIMESDSADDIDGYIGAHYWTRKKDGRHRQLTCEAICDMHALVQVAKRKRKGLPVDQIVQAFRDRDEEDWADLARRAAEARAAGNTRSLEQRILEASGRAPRPG